MTATDDQFPTRPRPRVIARDQRKPSKFQIWAWSPITSFQVGLTASYLAMIYFGISAFIAQIPAFKIAAPEHWSLFWAVALVIGGVVGAFGSISRRKFFERLELVGALLATLTIGSYATVLLFLAYAVGDADRASAGAGFVVLVVGPLVRLMWLASQILRK